MAVETCVNALKTMSRAVTTPEEISQVLSFTLFHIYGSYISNSKNKLQKL